MDLLKLPATMGWQDWVGLFSYAYVPYGLTAFAWFISTGGRRAWVEWAENIAGGRDAGGLQVLKAKAERALSLTEPRDLDALADWLVERPRTQRNANLVGLIVYTASVGALLGIYPAACVTNVNVPMLPNLRWWLCGAMVGLVAVSGVPLAIIVNLLHIHGPPAKVAARLGAPAASSSNPQTASSPIAATTGQLGFVEIPFPHQQSADPPTNPSMRLSTLPGPPSEPPSPRRLSSKPPKGERRHATQRQRYDGGRARISLHTGTGRVDAQLLDFTANHHGLGIVCKAALPLEGLVCLVTPHSDPRPYTIRYRGAQKSQPGGQDRYGLEAVC